VTARWCFAAVGLAGLACRVIGAGDRRLTLQFANPADYAEHDVERRVLAPFLELNPGVRVVQQSVASYRGGGEYRDRIVMSIGAGAPPDVFLLDQSDAPSLVDGGLLLDLAPYLPRLNVDLSRYDSTVLGIFRRGAAVYALPKGYTPIVLAYNRDLFSALLAGSPETPMATGASISGERCSIVARSCGCPGSGRVAVTSSARMVSTRVGVSIRRLPSPPCSGTRRG